VEVYGWMGPITLIYFPTGLLWRGSPIAIRRVRGMLTTFSHILYFHLIKAHIQGLERCGGRNCADWHKGTGQRFLLAADVTLRQCSLVCIQFFISPLPRGSLYTEGKNLTMYGPCPSFSFVMPVIIRYSRIQNLDKIMNPQPRDATY